MMRADEAPGPADPGFIAGMASNDAASGGRMANNYARPGGAQNVGEHAAQHVYDACARGGATTGTARARGDREGGGLQRLVVWCNMFFAGSMPPWGSEGKLCLAASSS